MSQIRRERIWTPRGRLREAKVTTGDGRDQSAPSGLRLLLLAGGLGLQQLAFYACNIPVEGARPDGRSAEDRHQENILR